jgi:prevent-host-death family protein
MPSAAPDDHDEVAVRDLTHHTSRVLARVKAGESVTITERGKPIATVVPIRAAGNAPRPAAGYASSGDSTWATRADAELSGFGE